MKSAHLVAISPELIAIGFPNNSTTGGSIDLFLRRCPCTGIFKELISL